MRLQEPLRSRWRKANPTPTPACSPMPRLLWPRRNSAPCRRCHGEVACSIYFDEDFGFRVLNGEVNARMLLVPPPSGCVARALPLVQRQQHSIDFHDRGFEAADEGVTEFISK